MKTSYKYLILGCAFGLVFPFVSVLIDTVVVKELAISDAFTVFNSSVLHYIIATAPIFLGAAFYIAGFQAEKLERKNIEHQETIVKLENAFKSIDSFNYEVTHELKSSLNELESLAMMVKRHANREDRREEIIAKLVKSSKKGTQTVNKFVRKVDDLREELNDEDNDSNSKVSNSSVTDNSEGPHKTGHFKSFNFSPESTSLMS